MLHSLRNRNKFRGPSSSKEFNEQNKNIRKDIELVYHLLNDNERDIAESNQVLINENFFLQRRVEALEGEVRKLETQFESDEEKPVVYSNFYNSSNIHLDTSSPVIIDREYGVAMPRPTSITNKLSHLTDSGRTIVPHDLEVIIEEEHTKEFRSIELREKMRDAGLQEDDIFTQTNQVNSDQFERIVDKKRDTFWTRQVVASDNLELFGRMIIRVPKEGVTNLFSNTLTLSPYPEGSMTIHSIMVKGLGNQWDLLDNYPTEEDVPLPIRNAGKLLFHFPRREITEIIINFSQPYFLQNNEDKVFTYGFQGVDLEYRLFTEKASSFLTEINVASNSAYIQEVDTPQVVPAVGATKDIDYLIDHKLFLDKSLETEFNFNTDILTPVDKVYVQTTLKRDGEKVPVLREIQTSYTLQD